MKFRFQREEGRAGRAVRSQAASFRTTLCGTLRAFMAVAERSPRVLVVDNYDSFTFNLVQCLTALGADCTVQPNDAASPGVAQDGQFDGVLISPGPGTPEQAGRSLEIIAALAGVLPVLGVCLGHQALAQAFGARVERAPRPVHGKTSLISHDGRGVFRDLPSPFPATRYHSLMVAREELPRALQISAEAPDGAIMGLRHRDLPLEGVQFHPESILTEHGPRLVQNWLTSL